MEQKRQLLLSTQEIVSALGEDVIDSKPAGPELDIVTYRKRDTGEICVAVIKPDGVTRMPLSQLSNPSA